MSKQQYPLTGLELAVIGMAVRLPGADTLEQFWDNLANGKDCVSHFSAEQMIAAGANAQSAHKDNYVKAKGVLNQGLGFEPAFFGYAQGQAQIMDPQFRVFHECVYQALAHSGYQPKYYAGSIGLYAGCGANPMWRTQFLTENSAGASSAYQIDNLTSDEYFCTRIAHSLDFTGPAITVQTACSSALVAVHMAAQALIAGDCDIAVAGGIEMSTNSSRVEPEMVGYFYQEGMIASPTGRCRPFSSDADGTLFSDGGGAVVLKRFDDALEDGDTIHGLIKSTAINNDGQAKVGFTAPSVIGQSKVISSAMQMGEVDAATISYIEAHGTATNLGDPIEIQALEQAFSANTSSKLASSSRYVGSVKSNLGHLGAGAGIAGLIKVLLGMKHQQLPATVGFVKANPVLRLEQTPFNVNGQLQPWHDSQHPLRAGVSAFGIGGTNAHVIVEQFIESNDNPKSEQTSQRQQAILPVSSTTQTGLVLQYQALLEQLESSSDLSAQMLANWAYTLQQGRRHCSCANAFVVNDFEQLKQQLKAQISAPIPQNSVAADKHKIVFMFAGQGSQYVQMAQGLYFSEPSFAKWIDTGFDALANTPQDLPALSLQGAVEGPVQGQQFANELKALFLTQVNDKQHQDQLAQRLNQTQHCQPLLVIIQWSLAKYFQQIGVKPWAMIGHSLGEYTAATLAGVFELSDVLYLLQYRAWLMAKTQAGGMLSVRLDGQLKTQTVVDNLPQGLSVAAFNSSKEIVIAGAKDKIDDYQDYCQQQHITAKRLPSQLGFHCHLMTDILPDFAARIELLAATGRMAAPKLAYISNLTGDWINQEQALSGEYWCQHMAQTVQFEQGLNTLAQSAKEQQLQLLLVECSAGKTLTGLAKRSNNIAKVSAMSIRTIEKTDNGEALAVDDNQMPQAIAALYQYGVDINWPVYNQSQPTHYTRFVPLVGYQFERQLYKGWQSAQGESSPITRTSNSESANCFYSKNWQLLGPFGQFNNQASGLEKELKKAPKENLGQVLLLANSDVQQVISFIDREDCYSSAQQQSLYQRLELLNSQQKGDSSSEFSNNLSNNDSGAITLIYAWQLQTLGQGETQLELNRAHASEVAEQLQLFAQLLNQLSTFQLPVYLTLITVNGHRVNGLEAIDPYQNMFVAYARAWSQENTLSYCQQLDIDDSDLSQINGNHFQLTKGFSQKALRQGVLWQPCYQGVENQLFDELNDDCFGPTNHILITGGLGHIGLLLVEQLVQQAKCQLEQCQQYRQQQQKIALNLTIVARNIDTANAAQLDKLTLNQDKNLDVKIKLISADVAATEQMSKAIDDAQHSFGPLTGVIHCAGKMQQIFAPLQAYQNQQLQQQMAAKVDGVQVLNELLTPTNCPQIQFILLMSSLATELGGLGHGVYAGVNSFMDSFSAYKQAQGDKRWQVINWDDWQGENINARGMSDSQGADSFALWLQLTASYPAQHQLLLVHQSHNNSFYERLNKANSVNLDAVSANVIGDETSNESGYGSNPLSKRNDWQYQAPCNEVEQLIAQIWQQTLEIAPIGRQDSFFDLGGDSLMAVGVFNALKRHFDLASLNFTMADYFQTPCVEAIAKQLLERISLRQAEQQKLQLQSADEQVEEGEF